MQRLLILPVLDTEALAAATNDGDPEVRWRARKILQVGRPETERMLYAAFKTIEEKKLSGTLESLMKVLEQFDFAGVLDHPKCLERVVGRHPGRARHGSLQLEEETAEQVVVYSDGLAASVAHE